MVLQQNYNPYIFSVFEFVNNIPIQFWVIVMKRLKLFNQRVLVLPVFELPQSGILLVKFEITYLWSHDKTVVCSDTDPGLLTVNKDG